MNFTPNDDTEKLLRSMWFGFTDKSFDKKGKQWSFTGSPYISKVGGNGADSVVFDGSTTISATNFAVTAANYSINFTLQLAEKVGTIIETSKFTLTTSNLSSYLSLNTPMNLKILGKDYEYNDLARQYSVYINGTERANGNLGGNYSTLNIKLGEGMKGFISNFSVVTNGNTISQFQEVFYLSNPGMMLTANGRSILAKGLTGKVIHFTKVSYGAGD